jgi:hypothetical protein
MHKELYFDISSEQSGGSLYRIREGNGRVHFLYQYSLYNDDSGELKLGDRIYPAFDDFWKELVSQPAWYYFHPLFVHPEQRERVREQLSTVDWEVHPDRRWQESHRRQWKKVLEAPEDYYRKDE